jgi:hypothetical protein
MAQTPERPSVNFSYGASFAGTLPFAKTSATEAGVKRLSNQTRLTSNSILFNDILFHHNYHEYHERFEQARLISHQKLS